MVKIAWGITGCGDKIGEIVELLVTLKNEYPEVDVDIYYSQSAEMVLNWYKLMGKLKDTFYSIRKEVNPNAPFLPGMLQTGKYDLFLVAPLTANSVAKIAHGIADTLITNSVAQGTKAMVPTYIYPPDNKKEEIETILPGGKTLKLYIRDTDVKNVEILKKMQSITVLENVSEIKQALLKHVKGE
ncbi:Archaeoflavoprotein AfpA [Methanococcus vannielii SB]|jgi:archaeoflavoprotein AfpA|uniref:Archaeoflavoprotein AfpA n=1 Tax=Methanococcus vannielii (strain ATCC 35089 / DSM 1224 / JCM 13029 / OCM 148 / SB) TaxID=406327 RepID=A6UPH2_METVS|nr:archaeoflavoprotein AfpA [Methanococcus vannielii]ABR54394.1 Archaeoflavoprotein AfpA [Methanococcus vannielii SB]